MSSVNLMVANKSQSWIERQAFWLIGMAIQFSRWDTKLERLAKNEHTQRKLLNFENWWQKVSKFDFQSRNLSQFRSTFLISSIFKSLYFIKWCPIFDSSPLHQFAKFTDFLWVDFIIIYYYSLLLSLTIHGNQLKVIV